MTRAIGIAVLATILMAFAASSPAAVFNIRLHTDSNPDFTTRETFLATALPVWDTPEEQAIALWRWGVRHRRQVTPTRENGRSIFDPIQFFNNYGGTNCGYITGMLQGWVEGMGAPWRARYVQLSDHTVMEMSWDDGLTWHMFDASMVIHCRNAAGQVASVAEIGESHVSELALQLGETGPVAGPPLPLQLRARVRLGARESRPRRGSGLPLGLPLRRRQPRSPTAAPSATGPTPTSTA